MVKKKLNEEELTSKISVMARQAVGFSSQHIANKQEEALKLYKREALPGDDKLRGRSGYVSPDVMERVNWFTANLIRVFDSQQEVVNFLPNGPEDEPLAVQMTDGVNFIVRSKNSHVAMLEPWVKNALITGLGITTVDFRACREEGMPELLNGISDEQLVALQAQEEAGEIIIEEAGEPYSALPPMPDPNTPPEMQAVVQAMSPMVRDLKIRRVKTMRQMNIVNLPPEDFIVSKDAEFDQQTGGIRAKLQGHRRVISRQDLIEQGFEAEKVAKIVGASDKTDGMALERSEDTDFEQGTNDVTDDVTVYEIYTKIAIENEKRRHYRITIAGDLESAPVLLNYVEVSKFYPYAAFCPFPMPNTLFGHGIADIIGDDQILLSKMQRGVIDSLNFAINPIKVINPEVTNIDDALNLFPGAVIRSAEPSGGITYNTPPFSGAAALPVMGDIRQTIDFTTGVGGGMMAVNASDLQNTTATATSQRANASQMLVELTARHFADTGYRYLFKVMVDLLAQFPEDAQAFFTRLTGNYVPLQVDQWDPDMDVTTTVAFGVMNKDFNAAVLNSILEQQKQMAQLNPQLVTPQNMYTTLVKIAENAGFKNPNAFWVDPSTLPPPQPAPPPPDPNAALIEEMRIKAQLDAEAQAREYEFEMRKLIIENDLKRDQMAQDLELKRAEIAAKYQADVDIARIQQEQARERNDVDFAIVAQQTQQEYSKQKQEQEQQEQAAMAQMMQTQAQQAPMPPMA